ncbi:MAG: hypothetical protein QOE36_2165 [Gaiellaceae bacterium]|jgi:hypothetical protein|nr:hypothetical protein [Gaiellaceae bacterium]
MKKVIVAVAAAALFIPAAAPAKTAALSLYGTGKISTTTTSTCAGVAQGCLLVKGSVKGSPLKGSFEGKWTVNWNRATTSNGRKCATGGGEVQISDSAGNSLTLSETGKLCQATATGRVTFTGSYTVSAGEKKYATQGVGKGKASLVEVAGRKAILKATGSFNPTATRQEGGG